MNALQYIEHFKGTAAWARMCSTVEASPWHREANVGEHTLMVLDQYERRFAPTRLHHQNNIARIALLYHDVGKPAAEEVVHSEERGTYRRYAGHEQHSAVAFTQAWLEDEQLRTILSPSDARTVRWIIEHHLSYGLKDPQKVGAFRAATSRTLGVDQVTFFDCLRSDAAGRISDDHEEKLRKVEEWIEKFEVTPDLWPQPKKPYGSVKPGTAYLLIGPSGSGKSTWTKGQMRTCDRLVSMDQYRLEYLASVAGVQVQYTPEFYRQALDQATKDGKLFDDFMAVKIKNTFETCRLGGGDAYIDNTNATRKSRARWVQEARNAGMEVVGVEFWNPLQTVLDRQATRSDKSVPLDRVRDQYFQQTCAWLGAEVDEVIVVANGEQTVIL